MLVDLCMCGRSEATDQLRRDLGEVQSLWTIARATLANFDP